MNNCQQESIANELVSANAFHGLCPKQIVFIDSQVADYQTLVAGVVANVDVAVLDNTRDGIAQITAVLNHQFYSTVHIVSHGSPGCLYLGNTQLSLDTLAEYGEELRSWFNIAAPLAPQVWGGMKDNKSSSLLLYGCNVAAGDAGEEFISKLHQITGAQIAASTTRIGNANQGGNWNLDSTTSNIALFVPFQQKTIDKYSFVLGEQSPNKGYGLTDNANELYVFEPDISNPPEATVINTTLASDGSPITFNSEGMAYRASNNSVYGFQNTATGSDLYRINATNGETELIETDILNGTVKGIGGAEFYTDPNTLVETFYVLYSTGNGEGPYDKIMVLNPDTGEQVADAFGTGIDALTLSGDVSVLESLAIDPTTGLAYGGDDYTSRDAGGSDTTNNTDIYQIDLSPGDNNAELTYLSGSNLGVDGEGLSFANDGTAYIETDSGRIGRNIYEIDPATGNLTLAATFPSGGDLEGIAFNVGTSLFAPEIDLDDSNTADTDFQNTFFTGNSSVAIADTDTVISSADNHNLVSVTIVLTNAQTGDELLVGSLPSGISGISNSTIVDGQITVTLTADDTTNGATLADFATAIEAVSFNNTNANPDRSDRIINVSAIDDIGLESNTANSTIQVQDPAPPIIDLDLDNSSFDRPGTSIYYGAANGEIGIVNLEDNTSSVLTNSPFLTSDNANALATNPDAGGIVYYGKGKTLYYWDPSLGTGNDAHFELADLSSFPSFTGDGLQSGGAGYYDGAIYLGAEDTATGGNIEDIYKIELAPNGKSVTNVTGLDIPATAAAQGVPNLGGFGDLIVTGDGDDVTIFASTSVLGGSVWKFDTATNTYTSIVDYNATVQMAADELGNLYVGFNNTIFAIDKNTGATTTVATSASNVTDLTGVFPFPQIDPDTLDYITTFTEGDTPVNVADASDADNSDANNDITQLTIVADLTTFEDGDNEVVIIDGQRFELDTNVSTAIALNAGSTAIEVTYNSSNGTFSISEPNGNAIPQADLDTLVRDITYENTSQNPTEGDRQLTFTLTDSLGATSDPAVSTITVSGVNDPPTVDLDNDTNGDNDAAYTASYAVSDSQPVGITDGNATIADPDDTSFVNLKIEIAGLQNGAAEILDVAGTDIPLAGGSTPSTVTVDGKTYNVNLTGDVLTFTIDGGEILKADAETLLNSIGYENTAANPIAGDRTFTVSTNDGEFDSNTATTTIQWDTDGDNVADIDDIDDDNDGILDLVEAPILFAANGDFNSGTITEVTAGEEYTQQIGPVTLTYTNTGGASILPFTESTSTNSADEIFASGTEIEYVYPQRGATQSMEFSSPVFAQFAITDVDQQGELHRIKVYDENGDIIPNPASFISTTAEGTTGTFPNGTPATFNDLGTNITTTPGADFVDLSQPNNEGANTFVRANMLYFDFGSTLISRIEVENNGTAGEPGFLFNIIDTSEADSDNDGIPDRLDIDADDDGITDNVEAQTTQDYIAPSGTGAAMTDADGDGLDDNYDANTGNIGSTISAGLDPVDSDENLADADSVPDYLDADSDNDGTNDVDEAGHSSTTLGADTDGDGLNDVFEGAANDDGYDVNDENLNPANTSFNLADSDNDTAADGSDANPLDRDLDYRDNDSPPIIDLNSAATLADSDRNISVSFTEEDPAVKVADGTDADVSDLDEDDIVSLRITAGAIANGDSEVITFNNSDGSSSVSFPLDTNAATPQQLTVGGTTFDITYDSSTGEFNLTDNDTGNPIIPDADLDTLVRNITYENTSDNPTTDNPRTLTFTVTDAGGSTSNPAVSTINVTGVNDPPILDLDANDSSGATNANYQTKFSFDDGTAVAIGDADVSITDIDDTNIESATITLVNPPNGNSESLTVSAAGLPGGIVVGAGSTDSVIILEGSASLADYQTAISRIVYNNTEPAGGGVFGGQGDRDFSDRTVTVVVSDGDNNSNTGTTTIEVVQNNNPPTLDLNGAGGVFSANAGTNFNNDFTEDAGAVAIVDTDVEVTDSDGDNIQTANVTLTNPQTGDRFLIDGNPVSVGDTGTVNGISYEVVDNGGGELAIALSGSATAADYQTALQAITFENTDDDPDTSDRNIEIVVSDGIESSPTRTTTISVTPVNDPPIIDLDSSNDADNNYTTTFVEGAGAVGISDVDPLVTDGDDTNIESATIVLQNAQAGDILSVGALPGGIAASIDTSVSGEITVTLTNSATKEQYQQAIAAIGFNNTSQSPDTTPRQIDVTVNDGDSNSNIATTTVNITPVNDPPTVDLDADNSSLDEPGTAFYFGTENGEIGIVNIDDDSSSIATTSPFTTGIINSLATDPDAGGIVYYGVGTTLYYWDPALGTGNDAHFALADLSSYTEFTGQGLQSGGAGYYDGALYVGAEDDPDAGDIEDIYKIELSPDGKSIISVNGLDVPAAATGYADLGGFGDLIVTGDGDDATIYAVTAPSGASPGLWKFDTATSIYTPITTYNDLTGTIQLAADELGNLYGGDGTNLFAIDKETGARGANLPTTTAATMTDLTGVYPFPQVDPDLRDYSTTFTEGDSPVRVSDLPDPDAADPENNITELKIDVDLTSVLDNADGTEQVIIGGNTFVLNNDVNTPVNVTYGSTTFAITYDSTSGQFTIVDSDTANPIVPQADLDLLLETITYEHTSDSPTAGDRTLSFTATDATNLTSDPAVATITVVPVNDPPVINLDPTNTTGGDDNGNFEVSILPGTPVNVAEVTTATGSDPDGRDIDFLELTVSGILDGNDEQLFLGDTPVNIPLATATGVSPIGVTVDGVSYEIAVDTGGANPVLTITKADDTQLNQDEVQDLLRDLTYDNTATTPQTGDRIISFVLDDGTAESNTVTSTITVQENLPPDAVDDSYSTPQDTVLNVPVGTGVLDNDSDPEGDNFTVTNFDSNSVNGGTVSVNSDGSFDYTPATGFFGTDTFTYTITDDLGNTDTATVSINVAALPEAEDDYFGTDRDSAIILNLLGNDSTSGSFDPATLTVTNESWDTTSNKTPRLTINPDGTVDFGFADGETQFDKGTYTFDYSITDDSGQTTTATATVVVGDTGRPAGIPDFATTPIDTAVNIDVTANDFTEDSPVAWNTFEIRQNPNNGNVVLNDNGTAADESDDFYVYTPNLGFTGTDTFEYRVEDSGNRIEDTLVTIEVKPASDFQPTATNNSATVNEDSTDNAIQVLYDDDFGEDGAGTGEIAITGAPTNGTASVDNNGTPNDPTDDFILYTPDPDFDGNDQLTYQITDASGDTDTATLDITVNPINDPPVVDLDDDPTGDNDAAYSTTYTEGNAAVGITDGNATITDLDDTSFANLKLRVLGVNNGADEILEIDSTTEIPLDGSDTPSTVTVDGTTYDVALSNGVLTFTDNGGGEISEANAETLLNAISYKNVSENPSQSDRTIQVTVNDGDVDSIAAVSTIGVVAVNDPPVIDLDDDTAGDNDAAYSTTFDAGNPNPIGVTDGNATITDPDDDSFVNLQLTVAGLQDAENEVIEIGTTVIPLDGSSTPATIDFNGNTYAIAFAGDTFTFTDNGGGEIPEVEAEALLNAINYNNTAATPQTGDRTISFILDDGTNQSTSVTSTISVNNPPTIDLDGNASGGVDYSTVFTAGGDAVNIADDTRATATDPDGTDIESLVLNIGGVTTDAADENLTIGGNSFALNTNDAATNLTVAGATATFDVAVTDNGQTFTITKNGAGDPNITQTDIDALLRNITYDNNAISPTGGDRTIDFIVNDGQSNSNLATSTIAINSPPVINLDPNNTTGGDDNGNFEVSIVPGNPVNVAEATTATGSDPDGRDIDFLELSIAGIQNGDDEQLFLGDTTVSIPLATATGANPISVTVDGVAYRVAVNTDNTDPTVTFTKADGSQLNQDEVQDLLRDLTYDNTAATPQLGDRVISFVLDDGTAESDVVTSTITVADNAPPDAVNDSYTVPADATFTAILGSNDLLLNDTDPNNDTLTVTPQTLTTSNGGSVEIFADGTFTYNPNGFTGTDNFDYTISDGNGGSDTATVTLNIDNALQPPTIDLDGNDSGTATVSENFETGGYSGGTGWTDPWEENNDNNDSATGQIRVDNFFVSEELLFEGNSGIDNTGTNAPTLTRVADLSGYTSATLSFDYLRQNLQAGDTFVVEISTDGSNFTEVGNIAGDNDTAGQNFSADISEYISETTYIRFKSNLSDTGEQFYLDNINIALSNPTDYTATFNTGGDPVAISESASLGTVVTDSDSTNLSGATITLTNAIAGDTLLVDGTLPNGISATVNGTGDVITLSGDATLANYETAIEALAFDSTNDDATTRNIEVRVTDDTGLTSNVAQSTININVIANDPPTIDLNGDDAGTDYSDNFIGTPVAIADPNANGATGSDPDGIDIESLTINVSDAVDTTNELLVFNDASGNTSVNLGSNSSKTVRIQGTNYTVNVTDDGTTINVTPTAGGDITSTQVEQLLRSITYLNNASDPTEGDRTFAFVLNDGQENSNVATSTITLPVNTPPNIDLDADDSSTATGNDYQASYISGTPVVISGGDVTITDATDTLIDSATIELTNRPDGNDAESLSVNGTLPGGIFTTGYDSSTGVITLQGSASLADYQQAIKQIEYDNTALASADQRVITVKVDDGELESDIATTRITPFVPPTIDTDYDTTFTEDRDPVAISDPDATITDDDSTNLVRATITLNDRPDGNNVESLIIDGTLPGDITTTGYDAATGTLILEGSASLADYQTAIKLIKYNNTDLTDLSDRTVDVVVNDGSFDSNTATTTIAMNTPPLVDLNGGEDGLDFSATFGINGDPVAIADSDTLVTDDTDDNIESATVILKNPQTGDVLLVDGTDAFTGGEFIGTSGNPIDFSATTNTEGETVVTLTSRTGDTVPKADYQELIEAITFDNTEADPDRSDRIIEVTVDDGDSDSLVATSTIVINSPPEIDLDSSNTDNANYQTTFTEVNADNRPSGAVSVASENIEIQDLNDTNIQSATITITNVQANDILAAGTIPNGIIASEYNSDTGTLTLTGSATIEEYETAIQAVSFNNTSDNPDDTPRQIQITVKDNFNNSNIAVTTVTVVPTNDPPDARNNGYSNATDTPTIGNVITDDTGSGADIDPDDQSPDTDPENQILTVTAINGNSFTNGDPIVLPSGSTLTINPDGSFTYDSSTSEQYAALAPGSSEVDSFFYTISDGNGGTDTARITIVVDGVEDPPAIDLDADDNGGTTGNDYQTIFNLGNSAIEIADPNDAEVTDIDNNVTSLKIVAGDIEDGASEIITIGGETFPLNANKTSNNVSVGGSSVDITFVAGTGTFTIANNSGGGNPIPQADLDLLVRGITYNHASQVATTGDRTFTFTATDAGGLTSADAVSTVSVNNPPVLDLNGDDLGTDYSDSFTNEPVKIAANNATGSDPDGNAIESLELTIGEIEDGNSERLVLGDTPVNIPLATPTNGTPIAVTVGGTVYDVAVDTSGDNPIVTFTKDDGNPLSTAETEALLRDIAYENTANNPTLGVRQIALVASDGLSDSDPVTSTITVQTDNDNDGIPDNLDPDDDNDGVIDTEELPDGLSSDTDSDNDGIADYLDPDTTGFVDDNSDGVDDRFDTDGDGIIDSFDLDSDNDGIADVIEAEGSDPNGDGIIGDATVADTDNDGLLDPVDSDNGGTALVNPDSDSDGIDDIDDIDADNDSIPDNIEAQTTSGYTAPSDTDTDGDGIDDAYDPDNGGTAIVPENTDGEDVADYLDDDSDNDGLLDIEENGFAANAVSDTDTDGDGLDDAFEGSNLSDPYDVNDEIIDPATDLSDTQNPGGDVDYRDSYFLLEGTDRTETNLTGSDNNDFIIAYKGEDTITGGAGNDIFSFNETSDGVDSITDFTPGEDRLDLSTILADEVTDYTSGDPFAQGYVEFAEFNHPIHGISTIVQIDFDAGDESDPSTDLYPKDIAFLRGVSLASLDTSRDFII